MILHERDHNAVESKKRTILEIGKNLCVPASLSQNGPALGAQADEPVISQMVKSGGFGRFRRAAQTSFNIVYEAKP